MPCSHLAMIKLERGKKPASDLAILCANYKDVNITVKVGIEEILHTDFYSPLNKY